MRIIVDRFVPFIEGILEPYAEVCYLDPTDINSHEVRSADALIVRTRTTCNKALLEGSRVQFIATATIGYDHIDTAYCQSHGIEWTNAPGCNAQGVCDYVEQALDELGIHSGTIGIIGVGHVGTLVTEMAKRRGMRVLLSDPPKQIGISQSLIAEQADVITVHTPLTYSGEHRTYHLLDDQFLSKCKPNAVIINAARGGILDEQAALLPQHQGKTFVIDTWEGEPQVNCQMLERTALASFHIAGYTVQGKINATNMCLSALSKHFSLPVLQISEKALPLQPPTEQNWLRQVDQQFRANPQQFEALRQTYKLR